MSRRHDNDREKHRSRENREERRDMPRENRKRKNDYSPDRNSHSKNHEADRRHRMDERGRNNRFDGPPRNDRNFKGRQNNKRPFFGDVTVKKEASPEWGKANIKSEDRKKGQEKEKPNFEASGKLTEDANTVNGTVIKYAEPQDARKPKRRWRLYPFKGEKALPTLYVHRQSAYLLGRDRKVADIPLDHPSCSKQHAALQYRLVGFQKEGNVQGKRVRPYVIDLDSANGTFVNNVKLEPRRFHELLERDVVKFGFSSREYVVLHEHSKDDELDDDIPNDT